MTQKHIINNFIHKIGVHCESSALRDMFEYYNFPMSEAMVFGLDATMGFGFFDKSVNIPNIENGKSDTSIFLGGKQGTITPSSLSCRLLGITLRKQSFSSEDKAWKESKKLLDQNIPMILQVDLGFLPYINTEENEEIHFGGHAITLAGYDEDKGITLVGDTEYKDFQEVSIEDLKKARRSKEGPSYLHPNNAQYSMIRRPDGKYPPLAAGIKLAIQQVVNNMLRPSVNYIGIQGLKKFSNSIINWKEELKGIFKSPFSSKETSLSKTTFELVHGYIETWGTGGGAFRKLYTTFLEEVLVHPEVKNGPRAWEIEELKIVEDVIPMVKDSANKWSKFAYILKKAVDEHDEDCINYVSIDELHNITSEIIIEEEELFTKLSKIRI
ncbi:MAG: DUF4872 domain-containing protein [Candidatus Lokiarchaeota archaeon]|nr:DUF4872 domain-containing protein [Candidatus Lokiarchaeota archaeon]